MKLLISICGSDGTDDKLSKKALNIAEELGKLIAKNDAVIVCGGHGGIMKAACQGAKTENGTTIGIMPYTDDTPNEYIDIVIPTDLGNIRNYLVSNIGQVMIAIGGRWGTLNEISYRMITHKPLILIKGTGGVVDSIIENKLLDKIQSEYLIAESAEEAWDIAVNLTR